MKAKGDNVPKKKALSKKTKSTSKKGVQEYLHEPQHLGAKVVSGKKLAKQK